MVTQQLLTTLEAAALLRVEPQTLRAWRIRGDGPAFVKLGRRVAYQHSELSRWLAERTRRSTSDQGTADARGGQP